MPNDNDTLTAIKDALDAATPGTWLYYPGDNIDDPAAVYVIEEDGIQTVTVADNLLGTDAHLIANAPEWLRYLLQQLEWWERAAETQKDNNLKILSQLQQSREENERISADREFWMNLYQQERDLCKGQKESLIEINGRISADAERLLQENERLRGLLDRIGNICIEHENAKYEPVGTVCLIQKLAAYSEKGE